MNLGLHELATQGNNGTRAVLGQYSVSLLDRFALMSSACAMVFYSMFVITTRPVLAPTTPLVLFGIFRYWYPVDRKGRRQSTDAYWGDKLLVITIVLWRSL